MSGFLWLASYPKSGNTWLRAFLSNLLREEDQGPADINALVSHQIASARALIEPALGIPTSLLTFDEIDAYRPAAYRIAAAAAASPAFVKIHDAYTLTSRGEPLVPADASAGAIYIVRNPLDVAVSLMHSTDRLAPDVIARMADENETQSDRRLGLEPQVRQRLLTWSRHVSSWLDQRAIPVHLVRYEDMLAHPLPTFAGICRFVGLPQEEQGIERAIRNSSFAELESQERRSGFRERLPGTRKFFRAGRAGGWRSELAPDEAARIVHDHRRVMRRLGYLVDEVGGVRRESMRVS